MSFGDFKKANLEGKYSKLNSWTFYRAKNKAMAKIHGTVKDQYVILHDYCAQLVKFNPGSVAFIITSLVNDIRFFERVYICLAACKSGFKFHKPIIRLDGCFLKGYCRGMLLAAIGINGNNNMFPLAYAVVEKENTNSWTWFAQLLKEDLDVQDIGFFIFISGRQKGLERALGTIYEGSEIRFCVRHLYANFKKEFLGWLLKQQLWACARATTVEEFKRKMNTLKETNAAAFDWLSKKSQSEWTKSHFRTSTKCDMLLNNLCESFNSTILD
uniref:MULE transposase domain-containing protein n=1 Tax=Cannabis sativa TaxID=3483 RepID=A0A803P0P2_CANSA